MILDTKTLFSENQAIVTTAPSTNVVDLGPLGKTGYLQQQLRRRKGMGEDIPLYIKITEDFSELVSLTIQVQSSDDSTFATGTVTHIALPITLAQAVKGWICPIEVLPRAITGRYLRLNYVVVAGASPEDTGTVTAAIVAAVDNGYRGNP